MKTADVQIQNGVGIHARPASLIVGEANKFKSAIGIQYGSKQINVKSMMGLLASGIKSGAGFTISCEGEDEAEALEAMVAVIEAIKE